MHASVGSRIHLSEQHTSGQTYPITHNSVSLTPATPICCSGLMICTCCTQKIQLVFLCPTTHPSPTLLTPTGHRPRKPTFAASSPASPTCLVSTLVFFSKQQHGFGALRSTRGDAAGRLVVDIILPCLCSRPVRV